MIASLGLCMALHTAAVSAESVVVLVDVDAGTPPSWQAQLEAHLEEALDEHPDYRWVPPPKLSLADAQMVLGCDKWSPPCMGQVATMMAATRAYVVTLTSVKGQRSLVLQLVDAKGRLLRPEQRLPVNGTGAENLEDVRVFAKAYLFDHPLTLVQIEADVPGAEVFLDEKRVGQTPLTLRGEVEPGPHVLSLRVPGRAPLRQPVEVRAGVLVKVEVSLGAGGFSGHEPHIGTSVERAALPSLDPALAPWLFGAGAITAATTAGMAAAWFALLAVSPCQESSLHDEPLRLCETQAEAYARGAPQMGNDGGSPEFGRTFKESLLVTLSWGAVTTAAISGVLVAVGALSAVSPSDDQGANVDDELIQLSPVAAHSVELQ